MRSDRKIEAYVEAVRERDALKRTLTDEPERAEALQPLLERAKVQVVERYRVLTGGELSKAQRIINTKEDA